MQGLSSTKIILRYSFKTHMTYLKVAMKTHELELRTVERKMTESDLERERAIGSVRLCDGHTHRL